MTPRLSILVPAFNEAARLASTIDRLEQFAGGIAGGCEILIVDDGSSDGTAALVEARAATVTRLIRGGTNRGKGAALRRGVAESRGEEVLLTDADLSTPLAAYERLRRELPEADLDLGSRAVAGAEVTGRQPWYRERMGKTFNLLVRWLVIDGFRDTQCGFKLLRGEVARSLFREMVIDRFAFDVELVWLASRRGLRVVEVGVPWADSPQSRVHPLRDSSRMLLDLFAIRWRHRREPLVPAASGAESGDRVLR
ncbi:MAG: glycosyltransferase family 2 protein [Thermoanaerobaculia bacterium]